MNTLTHTPNFITEGIQRATFVAVNSVEKMVEAMRQNRKYRKTLSELNALDDRELADIGLIRADIQTVARQTQY